VVVVGGGLAGLVAATLLGRRGCDVRLFESAETLGGRAQTEHRDGYSFNLGPHALYAKGVARRVLGELDVEYSGHPPASQGLFASLGADLHVLPAAPASLLRTTLFSFREKLQVARLLAGLPKLDLAPWRGKPVSEWIASAASERVRFLLSGLVRVATYANAPDQLDAAAAIHQIQLALAANVLYLDRGWGELVRGLERRAREAGVKVTTRARVAGLELARGAVSSITLDDGTRVEAHDVVIAGDPQTALRLAQPERAPALARAIAALVPVRAACLDLALQRLPRPDRNFALGLDRPLYLSVHSASGAALAPPGGALIQLARYLAPDETPDRESMRTALEGLADEVQPGWRAVLVHQRLMPAMTVSHGLPSYREPRPAARVGEIPGLWLAGDWVGEQGLLADAAAASAETVARAIDTEEASRKVA
jgi:phytoene dehydrogenase-like protein